MKPNIQSSATPNVRLFIAITVLMVILLLDIFLPLEFYLDNLFILCMFLIIKESRKTILLFSLLTLTSVLFVFALELKAYTHLFQYVNKSISLLAVMFTAALALKYNKLQDERTAAQEQRIKDLGNIIFMNSHKIRIPVTNIMGLAPLLEEANSQEDLAFIAAGMKGSIAALDDFTKELAVYIHNLKKTENNDAPKVKTTFNAIRKAAAAFFV